MAEGHPDKKLSQISEGDEDCSQIEVSGIPCLVFARNVNGKIRGHLSCAISHQSFKFEMNPTQSKRTNIDVHSELQRLYFGVKKTKNGQQPLSLQFKDSIDEAERVVSFLTAVKGSFLKHVNLDVEIEKNESVCLVSCTVKDQVVSENLW